MTTPADPRSLPRALLAALHQHQVDHVVIGGVAAALHGSSRETRNTDIVPDPRPENLTRLVQMLHRAHGRVWTPDFDRPIDVRFDPRTLGAVPHLRTRTDHGELNIILDPPGLPGGYRELRERATTIVLNDIPVQVAQPIDLIRSAISLDRAKDRTVLPGLWALHRMIDRGGPAPPRLAVEFQAPDLASQERTDPTHQALFAGDQLAVLVDHVRPALACVRRQLRAAVDDISYQPPTAVLDRRIFLARRAAMDALEQLAAVRSRVDPGLSGADLHQPPIARGNADLAANLAYQAEDKLMMTMQALADASRGKLNTDLRLPLTEARLHLSAADSHLDLMELHLEQTARGLHQRPERTPPRIEPGIELD